MSYYKILGFDKEPFSTSPDPDFLYMSKEHETSLTNVLIELRLKRGLSVILGDIGTGKTTLSRKLIQELKGRDDFIFSIVLDPSFDDEKLFLTSLAKNFDIELGTSNPSILDLRDAIEKFLFQKGVTENKIVTLIIDEAQKLSDSSLEVLRVLLNYETNEFKLLQLVLLGQLELHSKIMNMANFYDRISFKYTLNPLGFEETKELIEFRIKRAGYKANMNIF
ncbi:MAG: AAA family ATPase, partial [Candidatus Omnitrophica bacterium]|nr:AAA family ATPase [Candidatus Omnitrophota bacterium]